MHEPSRARMRMIGSGVAALLLCAGGAFAGAPALANSAVGRGAPALANSALGGGGTIFRGRTTVRGFGGGACTPYYRGRSTPCPPPYCGKGGGGDFSYCSSGFAGGGIRYSSCSYVPGYCSTGIYPWYYYPYFTSGDWQATYTGGPLFEIERRVGDSGQMVIVVVEAKVDEALQALQAGKFASARLMYLQRAEERRQAEESGEETGVDRTALRLAALAAAGERRYAEADRLFTDAYVQEPSLESSPMEGATLVGGTREMREIVNGAVAYAYKVGTADAWKMVAWLMQGEGRNERARAMMDRADQIANRVDATVTGDSEKFAAVAR